MTKLLIVFLGCLLTSLRLEAQGVKMMSNITTNSPDDLYATHIDSLGKGGFMAVSSKLIRDQLSNQRRKTGMLVYVSETDSVYQLIGGASNAHWIPFKLTSTPSPSIMGWQGSFATAPLNPQVNWAYYNTTDFKSYIWTGISWMILTQDGNIGPQGPPGPAGTGIIWKGSHATAPDPAELNWAYYNATDKKSYIWDGASWQILAQDGAAGAGGSSSAFNGSRPITLGLNPFTGVNPNTNDVSEWIQKVFYPSEDPVAGLTFSFVHPISNNTITSSSSPIEMMASGANIPITLNWTARRQASTEALASVTVANQVQTITSPAAGGTINGSVATSFSRNSTASFTNEVRTTDSKSSTTTISISFAWRMYYGFMNAPGGAASEGTGFLPVNGDILALANSELRSSRLLGSDRTSTPSGHQRLIIAYPLAWDPGPTSSAQIWIGGNESSGNFQRYVTSFTNASGGTTNYVVYVNINDTEGPITFTIK